MIEAFVEKYVPHLRYDKAEPFPLVAVGYTVFHEKRKSPSSRFVPDMEPGESVIEYAFYYDFDISNLCRNFGDTFYHYANSSTRSF